MKVAIVFLVCGIAICARAQQPVPEAAQTVIVFNDNDRDSRELAKFYAEKRGVPKAQVVGLKCPETELITRAEYDKTIATPLREAFVKNGWWKLRAEAGPDGRVAETKIRYVALMRGVPLGIKQEFAYAGDQSIGPPQISTHSEAAVDSELAVLGLYSRQISGVINNPYFKKPGRFSELGAHSLLLVCRLDAATPETVRRMVVDSIDAEREGLRGFAYIDSRGTQDAGLAEGDRWLTAAAASARRAGMPVILDNGEGMFPPPYPMSHAALYLGWYADAVFGPMSEPGFRFVRGAIAVHIHSFSAASLRNAKTQWCAPLLAAGAAATLGNVFEPYLNLTPELDVFHERLRAGHTFAEAAYTSQKVLSWMTTFVGDPLYRPFKNADAPGDAEFDAYRAGARLWFESIEKGLVALEHAGKERKSGVVMEGLGLLYITNDDPDAAIEAFDKARQFYKEPDDVLRASIHEIFQLRALNRTPDALALARRQIAAFPENPVANLLRALEADMAANPKN